MFQSWKILDDLFYFGYEILGWKNARSRTNHRKRRIDPVFHRWLANVFQREEDQLLLLPRDHLKTTWMGLYVAQLVLKYPDWISIAIVSLNTRMAVDVLSSVKRILSSPLVMEFFPDVIPNPGKDYRGWKTCKEDTLLLKQRAPEIRAPQIQVYGVGKEMTGDHYHRILLDDVVDFTTVTTAEQMKKTVDYWGYIQSMLENDGHIKVVGTHYHYNDLYNLIIRRREIKNIYKRPAVENGKIIYSSWFTKKDLEKKRLRQGAYKYACQYMLDPTPVENMIFRPPYPTFEQLPAGEYKFYIAVDPASSAKSYSDQSGLVVAAVNKLKWIYIMEAIGFKAEGDKKARKILDKVIQYKPQAIGIELGQQKDLRFILEHMHAEEQIKRRSHIPMRIVEIPVSRKMSKRERIESTLGAFVRINKIFFHSTNCTELIQEMDTFTGKGNEKDNLVDACSMIFATIDDMRGEYWFRPQHMESNTMADRLRRANEEPKAWRDQFAC